MFTCISFKTTAAQTEGGLPVVPCHRDKCVYNDAQTKHEKIDRRITWYGAKQSGMQWTQVSSYGVNWLYCCKV